MLSYSRNSFSFARILPVHSSSDARAAEYCREFASPHLRRVDHADDEAIWDALREFQAGHAALRGTSVVYNPDVERRYHRRPLTERLAAWLNGL